MSYMLSPAGEKIQLFPKGELDAYLESKNIPKLAEIPFNPQVGLGGEAGIPVVDMKPQSPEALAFMDLAEKVKTVSK
jgi:ATP-binding protein involved in chromosome partitioning